MEYLNAFYTKRMIIVIKNGLNRMKKKKKYCTHFVCVMCGNRNWINKFLKLVNRKKCIKMLHCLHTHSESNAVVLYTMYCILWRFFLFKNKWWEMQKLFIWFYISFISIRPETSGVRNLTYRKLIFIWMSYKMIVKPKIVEVYIKPQ